LVTETAAPTVEHHDTIESESDNTFDLSTVDLNELSFTNSENSAELDDDLSAAFSDTRLNVEDDEASSDNLLDFDTSSLHSLNSDTSPTDTTEEQEIESIDFDLSNLTFDDKSFEKPESDAKLETFEFNFEASDKPTATADTADHGNAVEVIDNFDLDESLDFDFSNYPKDDHELSPSETKQSEPEFTLEKPLDMDLLAISEQQTNKTAAQTTPVYKEEASEEFDFNFDFDMPLIGSKEGDEFGSNVSDLTDMDEYETKIDLAKAYVDMGDIESATMIAEEVLNKGNVEQKAIAKALLEELK
jgi:pilus assembly protein FimV